MEILDLGMPKRGKWSYTMSKQKLELAEQKEFREWCSELDEYYQNLGRASYYERNLETWRQLWRTLEMSDIILFVCDIRYPTLHFSHSVYKYITEELDRQVILVLNKVDMVHPSVSVSWKNYFEHKFPEIRVVLFSAFPDEQKLVENTGKRLLKKPTIKKLGWAYGAESLIQLAKCHYDKKKEIKGETPTTEKPSIAEGGEPSDEDYVTIGLIGQPNAGKSSLINGILQDKKVSVSKTPGHTKHFQTIFYSPGIRLCDCPGLVFPTIAPKQIQILSGMYPVAQVKEPYSVVRYVAERIDLVSYLRIVHPCLEEEPQAPWTAWYICFAWADKNGYHTARTGRPDVYRGANSILRLLVTGRLCLRLLPPEYSPEGVGGSYKDILKELISFATKIEIEESEEEEYSDESSEEGEEMEKDQKMGNKFSLLQEID
ncbi:guanine nucleotide-binding protein-like 1 isoform X2 [Bolinopsis microptera]